jgi:hypothetical protein
MVNGYIQSAELSVAFSKQTLRMMEQCHRALRSAVNLSPEALERSDALLAQQIGILAAEEVILQNLRALV